MKSIQLGIFTTALLAIQTLFADSTPTAASTSSPTPISYKDSSGNVNQTSNGKLLANGNCYATIGVPAVRVFAHTGWLTAIFDSNSRAFATTKLSGKSSGQINVADTRVGTPRPIKSGDTIDDMGFGVLFLDAVPWDFASLHLDLAINSSADSTVTDIVSGVSSVSKDIPAFQLSAAVNGGLAIAQVFDKLLFDQSRSEARLSGSFDLVTGGSSTLRTGCYVVFGADNATVYARYLVPDTAGHSQLLWDQSTLLFNGSPVVDVSYFIITVDSQANLYSNTDDAALNSGREWANPLQNAELSIVSLPLASDEASRTTAIAAIKADIVKGQTLLLADPDILLSEKKAILKGVSDKLFATLTAATAKAVASASGPSPGPQFSSPSTVLRGTNMFALDYRRPTTTTSTVAVSARQKFILDHAPQSKKQVEEILHSLATPQGF